MGVLEMDKDKKNKEIDKLRYENYNFFLFVFFVFCIEITLGAVFFFEYYGNYGLYVAGSMSGGLWGIWWYYALIQNPHLDVEVPPSFFTLSHKMRIIALLFLMGCGVAVIYLVNHPNTLLDIFGM